MDYSQLPVVPLKETPSSFEDLPVSGGATSRLDESYLGRLKNNLVAAADAASLGFGDEGAALVRSLLPGFQDYGSELSAIRGTMKDYSEVHPWQSLASSLIGGAASAPAMPAIRGVAGAPNLANAIKTGAVTGGVYGGAYGYGSGEEGTSNRLINSLLNAGLGSVAGGTLGAAGYGLGRGVNLLRDAEPVSSIGDEAGAINPNITRPAAGDAAPPEYYYLSRRMRDIPEEQLAQGERNLQQAVTEESPMFLPESVESSSLTRLGRFLAGNESSMDVMQGAIDTRKAGALERVSGILDELSPERTAPVAGERVQKAIQGVQRGLETERSKEATPLYQALRNSGPFESKEVKGIIKNERVQDAIKQVKKIFPEYKKDPDTSFDVLDKAKQWLYGEAQGSTNKAERRFIKGVQKQLVDAMDGEKPEYASARKVYEEGSTPIDELFGDKGKPMVDLLRRKPEHVGKTLLGLDYTKQLPELVKAIGKDGDQAIRDAVRAALQGKIELKRETADLVSDIVRVPATRARIKAVIGDTEKFNSLMRLLEREVKYADANKAYHPGSTTKGNFEEDQLLRSSVSKLAQALKTVRNPTAAVDKWLMNRSLPEETARRLANVLTSPEEGLAFYRTMLPWIVRQQQAAAAGQRVGELTGGAAGVAAPFIRKPEQ